MRTIAVVTTSRADFGIYLPILRRIEQDPGLQLRLIAAGMHLSQDFGLTVREIEQAGFSIAERLETLLASDTPVGVAKSMGLSVMAFAEALARSRPDILVCLGDRFEMHAAALAALPFKIPVAHVHGGELSVGAIDDALRHSLTKLAHLHFAATEEYARRIRQLGEEPWRIAISGAPALDNLRTMTFLDRPALEALLGLELAEPPLIVTFHPTTLEHEAAAAQIDELLAALWPLDRPAVFTMPNADTGGRVIRERIAGFAALAPRARAVDSLGQQAYFSLMRIAAAMIGNSSSGIIEAASFELPVVNIGTRQDGRVRGRNVIDVGYGRDEVSAGIARALAPELRAGLAKMANPYGQGEAAEIIVDRLKSVPLDDALIRKRFADLETGGDGP